MKLPTEWVDKAEFLLRDAEAHISEGVYWMSCFEAQQAAELYLKALNLALTLHRCLNSTLHDVKISG